MFEVGIGAGCQSDASDCDPALASFRAAFGDTITIFCVKDFFRNKAYCGEVLESIRRKAKLGGVYLHC